MDVAVYLRKSRAEEGMDLDDVLRRHKATLLDYCSKHSHAIIQIYEEIVSGDSLYSRPEMLRMLDDVAAGKYEAVVCMDIDRLGRSGMRDQGIILDTLKYSDTKIITPEKVYNLNDEMDEELTEFKSFFARRELKMINKRLRRGLNASINDGAYIANAPFGYKKAYIGKLPTLDINESEAVYVRQVFEMYRSGSGSTTIANYLNSLGIKPHRTDQFGRTSVMLILKNPVYIGKIVWNRNKHIKKNTKGNEKHIRVYQPKEKWTVVDGIHPPIIDQDLWDDVQHLLSAHYVSPYFTGEIRNPLVGLVKCGKCGSNMQMNIKKGVSMMLCFKPGCCAGAKLSYVEKNVLDILQSRLNDILSDINTHTAPDLAPFDRALAEIRKGRTSASSQIEKLYDLLEQGIYDIDTYLERKSALAKRINEYDAQEQKIYNQRVAAENEDRHKMADTLTHLLAIYQDSSTSEKNTLLKSVITKIDYFKEKKTKPTEFELEITLRNF